MTFQEISRGIMNWLFTSYTEFQYSTERLWLVETPYFGEPNSVGSWIVFDR